MYVCHNSVKFHYYYMCTSDVVPTLDVMQSWDCPYGLIYATVDQTTGHFFGFTVTVLLNMIS